MKSFRNWIGKLFHHKAPIMTSDDRYTPDLLWYDGGVGKSYNDEIKKSERRQKKWLN